MTKKRSNLGNQTWIKEASPDDPIYTRGFVISGQISPGLSEIVKRREYGKKSKPGHGMSPEDIELFGAEATAGFRAQSEGGTLSGADVDALREQADEQD